ncbi:nuclear transport factor 2 family protein [Pseudoduganella namucuonensis]|uniref:SnoaL-like domain-containing protein n=1 Tax=Pseudoduganella namucuonensis TaxID=1035707 RepID=A0A1I7LSR6_9BURK|nr:nuclear transport factor 2 family protein [Pseudoduganella namucuonensis]SFV12668.1 SnoaL-like domain-containing protein [Pseudoduganella namucuonensis]
MLNADDYFAIQNLLHSYPYALDGGRFDAVGQLLGEADVYSGGSLMASKDAVAVASAFRDWVLVYEDGTPRTRHMLANLIIRPDGPERAIAQSYVMVFQQAATQPLQAIIGGDYLDRLAKVDGRWKIVERHMGNDLIGDLRCHGRDPGVVRPSRAN